MAGFFPIFRSMLKSSIWEAPPATRCVWMALLFLADKNGEVEAAVPGLAREAAVSLPECEAALAYFMAPDPYSKTPDFEGRRIEAIKGGWRVLNYKAYRVKLLEMKNAEANRRRVENFRNKRAYSPEPPPEDKTLNQERETNRSNSPVMVSNGNVMVDAAIHTKEPAAIRKACRERPTQDIHARAAACVRNPYDGQFEQPERWPEVMAMAGCFADTWGAFHAKLGTIPQDKGLMTLLGILGAGITYQEYIRAVALSTEDEWFAKRKNPGLTTLTLEQVRRLLAEDEQERAS